MSDNCVVSVSTTNAEINILPLSDSINLFFNEDVLSSDTIQFLLVDYNEMLFKF